MARYRHTSGHHTRVKINRTSQGANIGGRNNTNPIAGCTSHADCGPGMRCENGRCLPAGQPVNRNTYASGGRTSCPSGQHWMAGTNGQPGYCMEGRVHNSGYRRGGRVRKYHTGGQTIGHKAVHWLGFNHEHNLPAGNGPGGAWKPQNQTMSYNNEGVGNHNVLPINPGRRAQMNPRPTSNVGNVGLNGAPMSGVGGIDAGNNVLPIIPGWANQELQQSGISLSQIAHAVNQVLNQHGGRISIPPNLNINGANLRKGDINRIHSMAMNSNLSSFVNQVINLLQSSGVEIGNTMGIGWGGLGKLIVAIVVILVAKNNL